MTGLLGQAPEQRCSAWPQQEAQGHVVYSQDEHITTAGRVHTTLRSLTVIHIQRWSCPAFVDTLATAGAGGGCWCS